MFTSTRVLGRRFDMLLIFALLITLLFSFIIARTLRRAAFLKQFGGPWSTSYSRLWLLRAHMSGRMDKAFTTVNNRYGRTARVAPHMLLTCDAELIKQMSAARSTFTRSPQYTSLRLHPTRDNITSVTDEDVHAALRRQMAAGYAGKENYKMEDDVDARLQDFLSLLQTKYLSDTVYKPVDLSRVISYFTLDVISTVAFGHPFGFLEKDEDPFGYIANLQEFLPAILLFSAYTELQKILRLPVLRQFLPKSSDKRGIGKAMGFAQERVAERFRAENKVVRQDMLQSFIRHGMTQEQLESETLTQITAGSDSSATALRMTLHYICTNPRVLDKLLSEAAAAIAAGQLSRPIIKDAEARQLPYLQACIKEGLRMYPPVTGLLAKQVPPEGATIDGKQAPGGTWVAWNSFGLMRDAAIFGDDVYVFRPERWLDETDALKPAESLHLMDETVGLVFGYGRFGCLGQGVAWMELNKAILEILLRFELQPINLAEPFKERCVGFYLHTDMMFRVTPRKIQLSSAHW